MLSTFESIFEDIYFKDFKSDSPKIYNLKNEYVLVVPGSNKSKFKIKRIGRVLYVSGSYNHIYEDSAGIKFDIPIRLKDNVDYDGIKIVYSEGLLRISYKDKNLEGVDIEVS